MPDNYALFLKEISRTIPFERIYTDDLRLLAWGTDAGFYRLIPKIVIRSVNENEVSKILLTAFRHRLPVTFRAAGTSLSGQAVSDSILVVAGKHWEGYSIGKDVETITLQPGIIGQRVNEILKPYGRKFTPDPASVKSAMVGGIVMNNASGMNCGTHANSDRVLLSARIVLADGTILDTGDYESRAAFTKDKPELLRGIMELRDEIRQDKTVAERIRYKYSIKNVTGLNMLPFLLYDDPFDIIAHLMVGSEGTLAFLSEITVRTGYDYPYKASAMLYFTDLQEACKAILTMKKLVDEHGETIVKSAEMLDKKSLEAVNDPTGKGLTAILAETMARSVSELQNHIAKITCALEDFNLFKPLYFTDKESEYSKYWAIRSGIFPAVGGTRQPGTTCLIEDVAFHIDDLPTATADLRALLEKHKYNDSCIYGHALEGNYHFIINQAFNTEEDVQRYEALIKDVITLVVDKYDGSLKAEHGTGRNMAAFVSYEWGEAIYMMMKRVKQLFDPENLLNPGVIFNDNPNCYLEDLKQLPLTNPRVDKCIECGFCEVNCLTCGFTLSSRQRIVVQREIAALNASGSDKCRLGRLRKQYEYPGNASCAGDGLCAMSCPMGIDTGHFTHELRQAATPKNGMKYLLGEFAANHFAGTKKGVRVLLKMADAAHALLGTSVMKRASGIMHRAGLPLWTPAMPKSVSLATRKHCAVGELHNTVVYFPSCINQTMGVERNAPENMPLANKMMSLLNKAGYKVVFPKEMDKLCCGTIWESKGMPDVADRKSRELEQALLEASEHGKYPVLCDQSPCLYRMRETIKQLKLYEPVEFIRTFLADKLEFEQTNRPVSVHITCSMRKMGLEKEIVSLAEMCSSNVLIPEEVGCCGFAGDKGFTHPEVNAYALRKLPPQILRHGVSRGYSNSRTCEIGLTENAGVPYMSIVYLVDECTKPKTTFL